MIARGLGWAAALCIAGVAACASADDDADNPGIEMMVGHPGNLCLAPDGTCTVGECNRSANYCFNPEAPCEGFTCGGEERGVCNVDDEGDPQCVCRDGYDNDRYDLYCCPTPESGVADRVCTAP